MSKLLIVRGLPGSGKSTYIRNNYPDLLTLETDKFNIVDGEYIWTPERNKEAIYIINNIFKTLIYSLNTPDFCMCGVYAKLLSFGSYVDMAIKTGKYDVYIKTIKTQYKSIHNVPDDAMISFRQNFVSEETVMDSYKSVGDKVKFGDMPKINI